MRLIDLPRFRPCGAARKLRPTLLKRRVDFRKLAAKRGVDQNLLIQAARNQALLAPKAVLKEVRRITKMFDNPLDDKVLLELEVVSQEEFDTGRISIGNDDAIIQILHTTDAELEELSITSAAHRLAKDD